MDIYKFYHRDESILMSLSGIFAPSRFDAKVKMKDFFIQSSFTNVALFFKIKLVVTTKHELENRENSIFNVFFGTSGLT